MALNGSFHHIAAAIAAAFLIGIGVVHAGDEKGNAQKRISKGPRFGLEFDGDDDRIVVEKFRYDGSFPITIEAIAVPHSDKKGSVFVDFEAAGVGLHLYQGQWMFNVRDQQGYRVAFAQKKADFERPAHLAGVFDGKAVTLFIDGELQTRMARLQSKFKPSGLPFLVGSNPTPNDGYQEGFHGRIDGVRLTKGVRYTKGFEPPATLTKDEQTLILLDFSEGQGATAHDSSGNGYDGVIHGAKWVKIESAATKEANP